MSEDVFGRFVARVRGQVDAWLASWLEARIEIARRRGPAVHAVAEAMAELVLRGGKRLRPALLAASYEACGGEGGADAVVPAGAALELLQGYLLVHDDWMDGDDVRRGGPSVPARMAERFPAVPEAASVLAGDLGSAWAIEAFSALTLAPARAMAAVAELGTLHADVVQGQVLDVCAEANDAAEVEAVHRLKTASYTTTGPVRMGARLAGAAEGQVGALAAFAEPLGIAFQLRDDVLGTFGNARVMGKPSGGDLREGKRTALVLHAKADPHASAAVAAVLGRADAGDSDVARAVEALEACGARARVEARIDALAR